MVNILLVEDNTDLRKLLRIHLQRAGYGVYEAGNGAEALDVIDRVAIHLLVVDIMMPVMDGYELTRELREADMNMPVLMISARETLEDKREGFRRGIDDYMTKPVDAEELLMRVEALLRRCNITDAGKLRVGSCVLDPDSMTVYGEDCTVELRQKEFRLAHKLLSSPNRIFTRQSLMDEIWGYDSESDPRTVDTHIKRVREKLEPFRDFEIVTVRGLGYKAVVRK